IAKLLRLGVTRVEIGVQVRDDAIYTRINRGHTVQDVIDATARLRDAGFKVGYHVMPGLPGSTPAHDLEKFKLMFEDQAYLPDHLKIYPTQVVKDSPLEKLYERGDFVPYDEDVMTGLLVSMKSLVPPYCRIMRIQRQISTKLLRNPLVGDIRQVLQQKLKERGQECRCIRCKEIGHNEPAGGPWGLKRMTFDASNGKEWFITWQNDKGIIVGLVRLRIPHHPFIPGTTTSTMFVRELHVYGREIPIDTDSAQSQHKGVGKVLMQEAERIALEQGCDNVVVISGVGVREYYRKLSYALEGPYMVKRLR
ncbi:MAG: tRNA uridine(34) 5-carboxymethylaminomethyl modification radical SAM/GNAT enzyme Elp3, partial [Nanoarchaeota archaeon]